MNLTGRIKRLEERPGAGGAAPVELSPEWERKRQARWDYLCGEAGPEELDAVLHAVDDLTGGRFMREVIAAKAGG